jgi:hypothetical protein
MVQDEGRGTRQLPPSAVSNLCSMSARCLLIVVFCSGVAAGQLTGRVYLAEETDAPREPVFLYFEVTNSGVDPLNVYQANPYSFCSGYRIQVSSDEKLSSSCAPIGVGGSCMSSDIALKPKQKRIERILLNFEHKIDAPGDYDVTAERSFPYANAGVEFWRPNKPTLEVHAQLHFRIDPSATVDTHTFDSFVIGLHSNDVVERADAARTLAALAPKSLEETLLTFADDKQLRYFAPLALHRLNTSRSMSAMSDLLRKSEPGSYEYMESAKYLAESRDPQWFPLLLEVAEKNPKMVNYVDDAAESGGAKMLPYLFDWMQSPDKEFTRLNAISALGYTGSREAVPTLIDLLKNSELAATQRALWSLRQLTHLSLGGDHWLDHPESQYSKWLQWWARDGATAHIYKAGECGEVGPLS